jgi:zinc protease
MVRFPLQLAYGVAFNDIGYGSPVLGTPRSVGALTVSDVRHWHEAMLGNGRTTIVAVGDMDAEEMAAKVANAFERENPVAHRDADQRATPTSPQPVTPGVRIEYRDRKQAALAMLFPGPSRTDPERYAAETWGAIAAGLGGRLFESLRSARSLAYTVMANSWQRRRSGGLLTYIATDPSRLEEARDAMLEELELFRREPPGALEVSRASAMLTGHAEMSRQTASAFAGEIADAWLLGGGLEDLDDPAAPYRQVTAAAIHAVTERSLDPELRAEGVVAAVVTE